MIESNLLTFLNQQHFEKLFLATSGGVDSMVLLHAVTKLGLKKPVIVVHINHQIHANAGEWGTFVQKVSSQYNLECTVENIQLDPSLGLEEAARIARYQAFSKHMTEKDLLLTAHHFDDQKETFIFRALRGTSLMGLASMQPLSTVYACRVGRPLLKVTKKSIQQYALKHQLQWIDDPSNSDLTISRNAIRKGMSYMTAMKGFHVTQMHLEKQLGVLVVYRDRLLQQVVPQAHILNLEMLSKEPIAMQEEVFHAWLTQRVGYVSYQQSYSLLSAFLNGASDRYPKGVLKQYSLLRYRDHITILDLPDHYSPIESSKEWVCLGGAGRLHNPKHHPISVVPLGDLKGKYKKKLQALGIPLWLRGYIPVINGQLSFQCSGVAWHPPWEWSHWIASD